MSYQPPHLRGGGDNVTEEAPPKPATVASTTCVYVEGLPSDTTAEDLASAFASCGELQKDDQGVTRVKLYRNRHDQTLKGDGLVNFVTEEGASAAVRDLTGVYLRAKCEGGRDVDEDKDVVMTVTAAFFQQKERPARTQRKDHQASSSAFTQHHSSGHKDATAHPVFEREGGVNMAKVEREKQENDGWETVGTSTDKKKKNGGGHDSSYVYDLDLSSPTSYTTISTNVKGLTVTKSATPSSTPSAVTTPTSTGGWGDEDSDDNGEKGWGDEDSSDEDNESEEEESEEEVDYGVNDMEAELPESDEEEEDDAVKEKRRLEAEDAKKQAAQPKKKAKKTNQLSKKEKAELKKKEDEEFEAMLAQATQELDTSDTTTPEADAEPAAVAPAADATETPEKELTAKQLKAKRQKEKKKAKKAVEKADGASQKDAGPATPEAVAAPKKILTPAEVLAAKKAKKAKADAKRLESKKKADKMKVEEQKKAKAARAIVQSYDGTKSEKFHFSKENSSGCDAG